MTYIELAEYREILPEVLLEISKTREQLPEILEQAEVLISPARNAGKEAAEGSVTGVFSGLFKAPVSMVSSLRPDESIVENNLTDEEKQTIENALVRAVESGKKESWRTKHGNKGFVSIIDSYLEGGKQCFEIRHEIYLRKTGKTYVINRDNCTLD